MPGGRGYWVATNKGQVFAFGKAKERGELAGPHPVAKAGATVVGIDHWPDPLHGGAVRGSQWLRDDLAAAAELFVRPALRHVSC
jgi:hypothetical protein